MNDTGSVALTSPEAQRSAPRARVSLKTVRFVLILAVVGVLASNWREWDRRIRFWRTGTVLVDGCTFYLQPTDTYLTQFVLDWGSYEPEETRLFRSTIRPGDTVVDVGANIGWYTVIASKLVGERGRVIAFEPDPISCAYLRKNVAANGCQNVTVEQKALSNKEGKLKLFLAEDHLGRHRTSDWGDGAKSVVVDTVTLDSYLSGRDTDVDVVKIDTEGAEGVVLEGMEKTLADCPAVKLFVEFGPENLVRSGYDPSLLFRRLKAHGFVIHAISETPGQVLLVANEEELRKAQAENPTILNLYLCRGKPEPDTKPMSGTTPEEPDRTRG